jgi:hypothetical protein
MPFTPFHMGPGIAVKAVTGRHFSLMLFGFSQVAIDIEPLVGILRRDPHPHGFTDTYVGATLIALASVAIGRPVCQFFLNFWTPDDDTSFPSSFLRWLRGPQLISWPAAIAGAFVGTYSHVFLDSIMHADMHPLVPLSDSNPFLHMISVDRLHDVCVVSGVLGALLILGIYCVRRAIGRDGRT